MTAPIEVSGAEGQAPLDPLPGGAGKVEGRSLGQIAWMRLRRDKAAMAGGIVVLLLILVALVLPHFVTSATDFHQSKIDMALGRPKSGFMHSGISWSHPFGLEPINGRDLFSRVVNGAKYSFLIAFLATLMSVIIGVIIGITAGFFGGWVDKIIARAMDVFLAFPILLFGISLAGVIPDDVTLFGVDFLHAEGKVVRIGVLVFVIGFFSWPYMGRIIRGQTLSLREREFVDASRALGAKASYILFRELLPNLMGPILVFSTLLIPTNILFEAALSFLGVGLQPPTPTWGEMLSEAVHYYTFAPHFMFFPGMAIFVTVMAFNLFGDGLRDALDPKSSR